MKKVNKDTINLSPRLLMVAKRVPKCDLVYDIGTDHCFLPIYLIQQEICKRAIASDIKKGPVEIAKRNIKHYEMSDNIQAVLSAGIEHVDYESYIIIAGMGADVIIEILSSHPTIAKSAKLLIIQCQSKTEKLRAFLWEQGYKIIDEHLTYEKNKIYNCFTTKFVNKKSSYTKSDALVSKSLYLSKSDIAQDYITRHINRLKRIKRDITDIEGKVKDTVFEKTNEEVDEILEELNEKINNIRLPK